VIAEALVEQDPAQDQILKADVPVTLNVMEATDNPLGKLPALQTTDNKSLDEQFKRDIHRRDHRNTWYCINGIS
jgi:hypothetical protein